MTNAELLRRLRAEAKAKGMCGTCRARPAEAGHLTCGECLRRPRACEQKNRAAGKCLCGGELVGGFRRCKRCRDRAAKQQRRLAEARRAAGVCVHALCAEPPVLGRVRCAEHLAQEAARAKRQHDVRRARGSGSPTP